jgi:hypothetical protein
MQMSEQEKIKQIDDRISILNAQAIRFWGQYGTTPDVCKSVHHIKLECQELEKQRKSLIKSST